MVVEVQLEEVEDKNQNNHLHEEGDNHPLLVLIFLLNLLRTEIQEERNVAAEEWVEKTT